MEYKLCGGLCWDVRSVPTQNIREVATTPPKTEKKRVSRGARVTPALALFKAFGSESDCVSDPGLLESSDVVLFTAGVADGAGRAGGETVCKVGGYTMSRSTSCSFNSWRICLTRSAALTPQPSDVRFLSIGASWPTGVANAGSTVNESFIVSDE